MSEPIPVQGLTKMYLLYVLKPERPKVFDEEALN
jgi:hypothetical protein